MRERYRAYWFDAKEREPAMVLVTVTTGLGGLESIDDLDTEKWMKDADPHEVITELESHRTYFDVMPGSNVDLKGGFTIYFSDQVFFRPPNQSVDHICPEESVVWRGNILVIKNAGKENVVDCEDGDKKLIHELVVR
jgi:hypothetical protein